MQNQFCIGDINAFLAILKILRHDNEFTIRFDHTNGHVDIESMMLASVVAVGIHLVPGISNVFTESIMTKQSVDVFKIDSAAFLRVFIRLYKIKHTDIRIYVVDDVSICIESFYDTLKVGSGVISTVDMNTEEAGLFQITKSDEEIGMSYLFSIIRTWKDLSPFFQASTSEETKIAYVANSDQLTWTSSSDDNSINLYSHLNNIERTNENMRVCLLPSVVQLIRTVFQFTEKRETRLSLDSELPVCMFTKLSDDGSFIRLFAGTKEL
jgi:hypothetical protein